MMLCDLLVVVPFGQGSFAGSKLMFLLRLPPCQSWATPIPAVWRLATLYACGFHLSGGEKQDTFKDSSHPESPHLYAPGGRIRHDCAVGCMCASYQYLFTELPFPLYVYNSLKVSLLWTVGGVLSSSLAA